MEFSPIESNSIEDKLLNEEELEDFVEHRRKSILDIDKIHSKMFPTEIRSSKFDEIVSRRSETKIDFLKLKMKKISFRFTDEFNRRIWI